jgi:hypothetical protein
MRLQSGPIGDLLETEKTKEAHRFNCNGIQKYFLELIPCDLKKGRDFGITILPLAHSGQQLSISPTLYPLSESDPTKAIVISTSVITRKMPVAPSTIILYYIHLLGRRKYQMAKMIFLSPLIHVVQG